MRTVFSLSKKKLIVVFAIILVQKFAFSQPGGDFSSLRVHQNFNMSTDPPTFSNYPFRINDLGIDGGRFFVAQDGGIGIGNPNPVPGLWPAPLAKLHLIGTSIMGGNAVFTADTALQRRWINLKLNTSASWGLWVDKGVVATDYAITTPPNWADFVFDEKYKLRPLSDVEKFIKQNKHLPEIPSAKTIREKGYTVHDINTRFMQKIEELTLYTIEQDKQINELKKQMEELSAKLKLLADANAAH